MRNFISTASLQLLLITKILEENPSAVVIALVIAIHLSINQSINQSVNQFIGIWQLEGWITVAYKNNIIHTVNCLSKNK